MSSTTFDKKIPLIFFSDDSKYEITVTRGGMSWSQRFGSVEDFIDYVQQSSDSEWSWEEHGEDAPSTVSMTASVIESSDEDSDSVSRGMVAPSPSLMGDESEGLPELPPRGQLVDERDVALRNHIMFDDGEESDMGSNVSTGSASLPPTTIHLLHMDRAEWPERLRLTRGIYRMKYM